MKLSNHNYLGTCSLCGKPVHDREEYISSKPKNARYWVYAHTECVRAQQKQKDREVGLK